MVVSAVSIAEHLIDFLGDGALLVVRDQFSVVVNHVSAHFLADGNFLDVFVFFFLPLLARETLRKF